MIIIVAPVGLYLITLPEIRLTTQIGLAILDTLRTLLIPALSVLSHVKSVLLALNVVFVFSIHPFHSEEEYVHVKRLTDLMAPHRNAKNVKISPLNHLQIPLAVDALMDLLSLEDSVYVILVPTTIQ
jgi:hypothetical protein